MKSGSKFCTRLLRGAAIMALTFASAAHAETAHFAIPPQPLDQALKAFGKQSGHSMMIDMELVRAKTTQGIMASSDPETALRKLLAGTGLSYKRNGDIFAIVAQAQPDIAPVRLAAAPVAAAETVSGSAVEGLVVTAQKRRENIQDVPIAISAFTQDALTTSQIAGGPDLMTQVPNVTFTKTNFSSYSIQIRGIGTQAISATVDPAVAVAFNNTPFVRNRFFEQEFYDLARIEVLRGPQGTLYGRNATAGVINILTAKPSYDHEARGSIDLGNFESKRLEAMLNIPLVEDKAALRLAGAATMRDGYVTNALSGDPIDGRNLWSTRLSLRVEPTEHISANLIYEHFEEDDDRLRSGKQLCHRDPGPTVVGGVPVGAEYTNRLTQGCNPASLYGDESFEVPNGYALPYYYALTSAGFPAGLGGDPYVSASQSRDLRVIESSVEPEYKAKTDIVQLQIETEIGSNLTFTSETSYGADEIFSFQDFNRFNTAPGAFIPIERALLSGRLDENGVFCDPQMGCSDRLVGADLSTGKARQFSQEFRLQSDFDGPFNFSAGANFLRSDSVDNYYVFFNSLTLFSTMSSYDPWENHPYVAGEYDNAWCLDNFATTDPLAPQPNDLPFGCQYIDPNPIGSLNDFGRNYFLSKNPYKLISYAAFGEIQYNLTPTLKFTGGLRWTVDKKRAPIVPSWLLTPQTYGLPVAYVVEQEWSEPTGRMVLDWKPDLAFTDDTMIYASLARGYKAGGANPPLPANAFGNAVLEVMEAAHPPTFDAEFVNAFELGTKNTLFDGGLTFNLNGFYYDYEGYQISQIVDRSALNLNFDATVWGGELEVDWRPVENLKLGLKGGYERTRMADGSRAIDIMDRTAGSDDWVVVKPFPIYPSNCVLPAYVILAVTPGQLDYSRRGACAEAYYFHHDPVTYLDYVQNPTVTDSSVPIPDGYRGFDPLSAPNGGAGFFKDLSGNELPNAPHFTGTITADYTLPLSDDWVMTLHTDLYYQSEAWTRVFNTDGYDKLKAYNNINIAAILQNEDSGWRIMAYIKNVLDRDSITGTFLNSDDTGLTTNVFLTEPRLFGVRFTKEWTASPTFPGLLRSERKRQPGAPYPFTLELGGALDRIDAPNEIYTPSFISSFSSQINPLGAQDGKLDWGDSRDIKLIYQQADGDWQTSIGVRFGRANGTNNFEESEEGPSGCRFGPGIPTLPPDFDPELVSCENPDNIVTATNYGKMSVGDREEHLLADFRVGREVGLGADIKTIISAGLRYAEFSSRTEADLLGTPDWFVPAEWTIKYNSHHTEQSASMFADRSFEGVGPQIEWNGYKALLGDDAVGHVGADWSLSGGILFGKQKAFVHEEELSDYFLTKYSVEPSTPPTSSTSTEAEHRRRTTTTVPNLGVSAGLSYKLQRLKVSAGYRYDRFFDVIDGGVRTRSTYDRVIEGPYFKVSVGFGG